MYAFWRITHCSQIAIISLALLISSWSFGQIPEPDYAKISAMLFPETADWTKLEDMKALDLSTFNNAANELTKVFHSSKAQNYFGDGDFRFTDTHFDIKNPNLDGFYLHDIDGDGQEDIVYSGRLRCGEGHATVIWYRTSSSYEVRQPEIWFFKLIRVKKGIPAKFTSISIGCCADIFDVYHGPETRQDCRIRKETQFPEVFSEARRFISKDKEFCLRMTPEKLDDYHYDGLMNVEAYGNIFSTYFKGSAGTAHGSFIDKNKNKWYFITPDWECDVFRKNISYDVCAGWVEADKIEITEASDAKPKEQAKP